MRFPFARALAFALLSSAFAASIAKAANLGEVNVYSYRQPYLIDPLFKEFTDETGIKVNVIFAEKGLIERIQAEGRNSPADVVLTVEVGNLTQATDKRTRSRSTTSRRCARGQASSSTRSASTTVQAHEGAK
jgi:iron(III) transport system substrate-binding protein